MATQQQTDEKSRTGEKGAQQTQQAQQGGGQGSQGQPQSRAQGSGGSQQQGNQRSSAMQRQPSGAGMGPFAFGPFGLIRRMQDDIDRLFGGVSRGQSGLASSQNQGLGEWSPAIETFQRGNEFVIRADLPGLTANDVTIEVGEDSVTISGERRYEHEEERDGVYVSEFTYGGFARTVPLPPGAITDNAKAMFHDGVLEIVVPAPSKESQRGRRLEIQQGSKERSEGRSQQEQRRS